VWTTGHGGTLGRCSRNVGACYLPGPDPAVRINLRCPAAVDPCTRRISSSFCQKNAQNLCGHSCMQTVAKALLLRTLDPPLFFRKFCGIILNKETMHFGNNSCLFLHLSFLKNNYFLKFGSFELRSPCLRLFFYSASSTVPLTTNLL
jgi:hypothetical protein